MSKIIQFGEQVEGYTIPVLNEREVRAAAGILFLATFLSLMFILFRGSFVPIKYVITFFLVDFLIRVFLSPRFSPTLILGRLIVHTQTPEYVGAAQKRFAWSIGVALSTLMFALLVVVNAFSPITGITCLICLIFLFFESAFGICLGCMFYPLFFKEKALHCPGDVCEVKARQPIQKTSRPQLLILLASVVFVLVTGLLFHDNFARPPWDMFGITTQSAAK